MSQPHKRSSLQALRLFYRRREKSCHWRTWQRRFEDGISHKRIYMNLSVCMCVRPLASGAMMVHAGPGRGSPPQKLQCFGCYAKVPALILDQPGPTQRPSNTTNTGKPHPLNTYILWAFSFWTLLIIVSWRGYTQFRLTKKKWWGGNYIILYRYTNNTRVALKAISVHSLAVGAQCQSSSMIFHQTAWKFLNVKHPH